MPACLYSQVKKTKTLCLQKWQHPAVNLSGNPKRALFFIQTHKENLIFLHENIANDLIRFSLNSDNASMSGPGAGGGVGGPRPAQT